MATRVSSAWAASINMVFDMEAVFLARSAIPAKGAGGSPNGMGGRRRRNPVAAAKAAGGVGQIRPDGSAGDKAHGYSTVLGADAPSKGRPDPVFKPVGATPEAFGSVKVTSRGGRARPEV